MLGALTLACGLLALPALAETTSLTIAQDRYLAGASVSFDGPAVTDLFMAGNRVVVAAPVGGSAHLAGRRVSVDAPVAGEVLYLTAKGERSYFRGTVTRIGHTFDR